MLVNSYYCVLIIVVVFYIIASFISKMFRSKFFISLLDFYQFDREHYVIGQNKNMLRIKVKRNDSNGYPSKNFRIKYRSYWADRIMQHERQSIIYDSVSEGIIDNTIHGFDNIILACGTHCSGKTFNITGWNHKYEGIIPRLIDDMMELRNDRGGILAMSCTEIKDNRMFDLLQADDDSDLLKPVLIKNVSRHHVESSGSAKHTFWKANAKRTAVRGNLQAPVHVYDFIVTLYYWSTSEHYTLPGSKCSKVQIAELAGVGRDSMKPLKHQIQANRAAMELSQLLEHIVKVNAKDDKRNSIKHMKSSSTLTMLKYFHDSLLKQYTTLRVICHIRPELELLNTNISVLEFGKSLRRLSTSTVDVPVSSPESMQLYIQTEHLAHELHLCGRMQGQRSMGTMTAKRYERLRNSVLNFLKSETDDIVLAKRNFVDIFTLLSVLREYHDKITNEENNEKTRNTLKFAPFLLKSLLVDKNAVKQTTEKVQQAVNQTLPVSTTGPEYWEAFVAENPSDFFEYEQMCAEIRDAQRLFEIDSKEILKYQENVLQLRDKMDKFRRLRYLSGIEEYEASTGNVIVPDKEKLMFQNIKRADAELTKVNENFVQKLNHLNRISAEHIKMNMDIHSRFTNFQNKSNIKSSEEMGEKLKV